MRRALVLLSMILVAPTSAMTAQRVATKDGGTGADARTLYALENGWTTALVRRDSAFFSRNLHPDYVYSDERGVFTKGQVIAEQLGGTDTVTYAANDSMRAHVHGSAAAVTGVLVVRGRGKDGPFEHRYRYTDSFVREGGRWLMFASQDYEIPTR